MPDKRMFMKSSDFTMIYRESSFWNVQRKKSPYRVLLSILLEGQEKKRGKKGIDLSDKNMHAHTYVNFSSGIYHSGSFSGV